MGPTQRADPRPGAWGLDVFCLGRFFASGSSSRLLSIGSGTVTLRICGGLGTKAPPVLRLGMGVMIRSGIRSPPNPGARLSTYRKGRRCWSATCPPNGGRGEGNVRSSSPARPLHGSMPLGVQLASPPAALSPPMRSAWTRPTRVRLAAEHSDGRSRGFDDDAEAQFGAHLEGILNALQDSQGARDATVWGRLEDNIGDIGFFDFEPDDEDESLAALDTALQSLSDADAFVIELRDNSGGSDEYALQLASGSSTRNAWCSARPRAMATRSPRLPTSRCPPFTGEACAQPVYVLTTNSTVSAAELFTLSMAQLPQVTIAGQGSNGILSCVQDRTLPNGWTFSLSNDSWRSARRSPPHFRSPRPRAAARRGNEDPARSSRQPRRPAHARGPQREGRAGTMTPLIVDSPRHARPRTTRCARLR